MQVAIFIDAGYLHAQGSTLLSGHRQPRHRNVLNVPAVLNELRDLSKAQCPDARLLRIYWYDGIPRSGRLSSEQEQLANAPNCKLRLGVVNSKGEQKGVDSLIVTDMIDLARNHAISDVLLLSGDEDIRIGVEIAQTFGVQVHLLGIQPARGSQSPDLIQESDTHTEWSKETVENFLTITSETAGNSSTPPTLHAPVGADETELTLEQAIDRAWDDFIDTVEPEKLQDVQRAYEANPHSVPYEVDRPVLGRIGRLMNRQLDEDEKRTFRQRCKDKLAEL